MPVSRQYRERTIAVSSYFCSWTRNLALNKNSLLLFSWQFDSTCRIKIELFQNCEQSRTCTSKSTHRKKTNVCLKKNRVLQLCKSFLGMMLVQSRPWNNFTWKRVENKLWFVLKCFRLVRFIISCSKENRTTFLKCIWADGTQLIETDQTFFVVKGAWKFPWSKMNHGKDFKEALLLPIHVFLWVRRKGFYFVNRGEKKNYSLRF